MMSRKTARTRKSACPRRLTELGIKKECSSKESHGVMVSQKRLRAIVSEIRAFCESNTDEAQVQKYARFFTEGYDAYGVPQDVHVERKDQFIEEARKELSIEDALKLGDLFLQSGKYESTCFPGSRS